ncbi:hypothetical protein AOC23_07590 [Polynucleobacter paneuropaeus]|jgi:hypothetical protein|nr:hypothetical protein [Polynucleobacter paneuropaeus]
MRFKNNAINFLQLSFIYIQGISFFNPIYFICIYFLTKCKFNLIFEKKSLFSFLLFLFCQLIAFSANPHLIPVSALGSLFALFLLTISYKSYWLYPEASQKIILKIFIIVLLVFLIDAYSRLIWIFSNISLSNILLPDYYDFNGSKEYLKSSTILADDTNTLAIRLFLISFLVRALIHNKNVQILFTLIIGILIYSCFSRATLYVFVIGIFLLQKNFLKFIAGRFFLFGMLAISATIFFSVIWGSEVTEYLINNGDSSVISKIELVINPIKIWLSSSLIVQMFGLGYFANIDVGTISWASGHSIVYYSIIEFGLIGSFFFFVLLINAPKNSESKILLLLYFMIGISEFRFDLLFLWIVLVAQNLNFFRPSIRVNNI